ncbi:MAG: hypothetical protein KGD59_03520 [Candidatus Heimdallarchaeota archaeon]|nr:hypothetical protein [Candidatus Heimdallarchaeota archaeon]MBY8993594.1 hypothetical protein [Candidatus Heimdallarchaeota archaeon]
MKKFPEVKGKDLEGKNYIVPYDLEGEYNIVIVPFLQYQQYIVNQWTDYLANLQKKHSFFEFYEIPTLALGYTAMRFIIDGGMRAGIPDLKTRQRTITTYINKMKFKKKLGIKSEKLINIYLLKKDEILWEEKGDLTEEKAQALEIFLSKLNCD